MPSIYYPEIQVFHEPGVSKLPLSSYITTIMGQIPTFTGEGTGLFQANIT